MNEELKKDYGTLIAKKSERLVTALYLVTDLISDNEPIKHSLRKSAVTLLSSMNALSQMEVKDKVTEFKMSLRLVTEILSFLQVAVTSGLVSDMNGNILIEGFRSLQLVLEKKQPILTKEMLLSDDDDFLNSGQNLSGAITSTSYDAITPLTIARGIDGVSDEIKKTTSKTPDLNSSGKSLFSRHQGQREEKVTAEQKDTSLESVTHVHRPVSSFVTSFQMRKQSRKEQILALFVKGMDISIKDISARIKGCSEKTIQRELNNLVTDGKVSRIGEKRWSRYILR